MFFDLVPDKGLIGAHRGVRSLAPENTALALEMTKKHGAHFLETDIQISKDGELVVFHDGTLERTTDIAERADWMDYQPWPVDQFKAKELRKLDAGSWFLQTDPFGTVASGEVPASVYDKIKKQKIPLLRELLEWSKARKFPINLEIKPLNAKPVDVSIVDKIMKMLQATDTLDLVLLSSFRHEYLLRARILNAQIPLAVLAEKQHPADLLHNLKRYSTVAYHPDEAICDLELIAWLRQEEIRVNCWTVNNLNRGKELLRAGAGIITDWPQRFTTTNNTP
jgi:glycerophosphoryl diester phosphodiesterase